MTRPDIANAVRAIACQAQDPAETLACCEESNRDQTLSVYIDAAYANRVAVMLGGTVVNGCSTMQHCVTLSTGEAECITMAQGAKAVLDLLQPEPVDETIALFEANQRVIAKAETSISGGRTTQIGVRLSLHQGAGRTESPPYPVH